MTNQRPLLTQSYSCWHCLWLDPEADPGHHDNQAGWDVGVEHEVPAGNILIFWFSLMEAIEGIHLLQKEALFQVLIERVVVYAFYKKLFTTFPGKCFKYKR